MKLGIVAVLAVLLMLIYGAECRTRRWGRSKEMRNAQRMRPNIRRYCYKMCQRKKTLPEGKLMCDGVKLRGACFFCSKVIKCDSKLLFFQHFFPSQSLAKVNRLYAKRSHRSERLKN